MYFWNTKALARELSANTLQKKHYKNYYLVTALLVSMLYYYGMYSPYYDLRIIAFESILTLIILATGIQTAYRANGGDEGEHFVSRITALSFPILVQTTLAGAVFGILVLAAYFAFNLEGSIFDLWYEWAISLFTLFLQILFFSRLVFYMKLVATHKI